jgi:hypothetical protein
MRISDMKQEDIRIGIRVKSIRGNLLGTIVEVHPNDDYFSIIRWDDWTKEVHHESGFYGNGCDCEVVTNMVRE